MMRQLGYKVKDISILTKVNRRTLCRWKQSFQDDIRKAMYRKFGDGERFRRSPSEQRRIELLKSQNRKSHLANKELLNLCHEYFVKYPFSTRLELRIYLIKALKMKDSLGSISNIIKSLRLTRKKPRYMIVKSRDELDKLSQKRKLF